MRRNRNSSWIREIVSENNLEVSDLILPIFIKEGKDEKEEIKTIPSVFRMTTDIAIKEIKEAKKLGIKAIALFPCLDKSLKTEDAKESYNPNNLVCRTIAKIKDEVTDIGVIADVALDPYTSHGHDGIVVNGTVCNDKTIEILIKQALSQAKAGCDIVAPSDMMDGRIGAIRKYLDSEGFFNTSILSYSAKYASKFYGPFRDAVGSRSLNQECDKSDYQLDIRNSKEAIRQIAQDIEQGADIVMIKPGIMYLDIIKTASENFNIPIFAYQVSGEYAMLKWASNNGCFNFEEVLFESLICMKRAGSSAIITYGAKEAAKIINS